MVGAGTLEVTTPTEREIVITRVFDAPRHLVFEACTKAELLQRWMYGPPERIVHTELFDEDWTGGETLVTWDLTEQDVKTTITMTILYSSQEARDGALMTPMAEGMSAAYDLLADLLSSMHSVVTEPSNREIVLTRLFDAPRELVWEAWTRREQVGQWWGPRGFTTTTHEMDVKPGGVWRFIMHGPYGVDYPNKIVYAEVVRPERLAFTHGADDEMQSGKFQVIVTFADQGGKTLFTMRSVFASAEERDKVVREYGAIEGGKQTLDRLAEFLAGM